MLCSDWDFKNNLFSVQALQSNASKMNTLYLSNVTMDDAGEYICMAESTHGGHSVQAMQSAWLDVLPGETHIHTHIPLVFKLPCYNFLNSM